MNLQTETEIAKATNIVCNDQPTTNICLRSKECLWAKNFFMTSSRLFATSIDISSYDRRHCSYRLIATDNVCSCDNFTLLAAS